ncbi:MAG: hypothetical protein NXH85_18580 [Pseudomonadaceae bacterium]|nr:hypothetical protein [Pseudomonadaceae bacterium]
MLPKPKNSHHSLSGLDISRQALLEEFEREMRDTLAFWYEEENENLETEEADRMAIAKITGQLTVNAMSLRWSMHNTHALLIYARITTALLAGIAGLLAFSILA